jgi:hypothetical protein
MSRNFSEIQKLYIRRSHKTSKYIRVRSSSYMLLTRQKLHKLLESKGIVTNIETDIKKYDLSPLVSARFMHNSGLLIQELGLTFT